MVFGERYYEFLRIANNVGAISALFGAIFDLNSVPRWQKVLTYGGLYPHKTLVYGHQTLGISNGGVYEAF